MEDSVEELEYNERKERFFKYAVEDFLLDWDLLEARKPNQIFKLNEMMRNLSAGGVYTMLEMVIFMFEDIYDDPKRLMSYLDKGNYDSVMEDIRHKYPEKKAKSILDLFMR